MSDIKSALEFAVGLNQSVNDHTVIQHEGRGYTLNKTLYEMYDPSFPQVDLTTLTGLRDYITANVDGVDKGSIMVRVAAPGEVLVLSTPYGAFRQRDVMVSVSADLPNFRFNQFMCSEEFIIGINAFCLDKGDKETLLHDVAKIKIDAGGTIEDDGVSQTVSVAAGARLLNKKMLSSRVELYPWSTFQEVDQPKREFVFRLNTEGKPGLFEADGGCWRNEAMLTVRNWLRDCLPEGIAILA
jgi:hypothetical protein